MRKECEFCGAEGVKTTKKLIKANKTGFEWKEIGEVPARKCNDCMVLWTDLPY